MDNNDCKHKKVAYFDCKNRKWKLECVRCRRVFRELNKDVKGFNDIIAELRRNDE